MLPAAAKGAWRNPPSSSPDDDRVSKAIQRLQTLLQTLVPLPGKPYHKSGAAFVPLFQIRIQPKLLGGGP
ncbi:hypothetical protein HQ447_07970 [bacterium]|nr:hypothetical protein [bacterium]